MVYTTIKSHVPEEEQQPALQNAADAMMAIKNELVVKFNAYVHDKYGKATKSLVRSETTKMLQRWQEVPEHGPSLKAHHLN